MSPVFTTIMLLATMAFASAQELNYETAEPVDAARFFTNFTSMMVPVNATILIYGIIFMATVAAVVYAFFYLSTDPGQGNHYSTPGGADYAGGEYNTYRSASDNVGNMVNIIGWISKMQEMYETYSSIKDSSTNY